MTTQIPDFDSIHHLIRDPIRQTVAKPQPHESASFLSSFGRIPIYSTPEMEPVKYLSRARRIEASLLPAMCFEAVFCLKSLTLFDQEYLKHRFVSAIEQMIMGEPMAKAGKLSKSIIQEAQAVLHGTKGGYFWEPITWEKIGMILYCLACDLTEDRTFDLVEGSVMHMALEDMKDAVLKKLHAKQVASAEDQAIKFRRFLQTKGYFQ